MQPTLISKTVFGPRLFGYNVQPGFRPKALTEPRPLDMLRLENVYLTKRVVNPVKGNLLEGGLYDETGRIIVSEHYAQPNALLEPTLPDDRRRHAVRIERRCIYMGVLHGHFGHFLVETLARSWGALDADRDVAFLFQYHGPVTDRGYFDLSAVKTPDFIETALTLLGLRPQQILLTNQDLQIGELAVPAIQFKLSRSGSPKMCLVYDKISRAATRRLFRPKLPKNLYLTRRQLDPANLPARRKSVANEDELEQVFAARGFTVLPLEQLSFRDQIEHIASAEMIAGTTGSALHMSMFNNSQSTRLFPVDWRNSRTQYILDAARNIHSSHIYCFTGRDEDQRPLVDVATVDGVIGELLRPGKGGGERSYRIIDNAETNAQRRDIDFDAARDALVKLYSGNPETEWSTHTFLITCLLVFGVHNLQTGSPVSYDDMAQRLATLAVASDASADHRPKAVALAEDVTFVDLTRRDLAGRWFDEIVAGLGAEAILVIGGFFDAQSPDVTVFVLNFLRATKDWVPLLIEGTHVILVHSAQKSALFERLQLHGPDFLRTFGVFKLVSDISMAGHDIVTLRGSAIKLSKALAEARKPGLALQNGGPAALAGARSGHT